MRHLAGRAELFVSFTTTDSESRLNFLRLLCQGDEQYRGCEESLESLECFVSVKSC